MNEADASPVTRLPKTERRQQLILDRLRRGETVTVAGLSQELDVSVATVRRDLAALGSESGVARTYGGAALLQLPSEPTMPQRHHSHHRAKAAIAATASALILDGDLVILDAGSTTEALAARLCGRPVTVVTNGIAVMRELLASSVTQVIVLGGLLRGFNETIYGSDAETQLRRVFGRFAFIGADSLDPVRGVGTRTYEQSRIKALMMQQAQHVVIVADASKLGGEAYPHWSPLPSQWTLITDQSATEPHVAPFRAAGAEVIIAELRKEPS